MNNLIQDMRDRLSQGFGGDKKPLQGLRVTANDMPRLPQSNIRNSREKYLSRGRPQLPDSPMRDFKKDWGGWL